MQSMINIKMPCATNGDTTCQLIVLLSSAGLFFLLSKKVNFRSNVFFFFIFIYFLIEFRIVQLFPCEIVVLRDVSPPVNNVDDRKGHREKNARDGVDLAD